DRRAESLIASLSDGSTRMVCLPSWTAGGFSSTVGGGSRRCRRVTDRCSACESPRRAASQAPGDFARRRLLRLFRAGGGFIAPSAAAIIARCCRWIAETAALVHQPATVLA